MVHVASSQRSRGDEAEDRRVDAMGCIRLFSLGHKGSLVISFHINRTPKGWWRGKHSAIPLPPPSHSYFLRGVGMLDSVREERRESESSLQSSKEWKDVVAVFTPCKHLILSI
jgi:hypothetical protein